MFNHCQSPVDRKFLLGYGTYNLIYVQLFLMLDWAGKFWAHLMLNGWRSSQTQQLKSKMHLEKPVLHFKSEGMTTSR